jgi:hypothetical protein
MEKLKKESVQFNTADDRVGFYDLFILCIW